MGTFATFVVIVTLAFAWLGRVVFRGERDNIVHPMWAASWVAVVQATYGVNHVVTFTLWSFALLAGIEMAGHWFHTFRPHYQLADGTRIAHAEGFSLRRLGRRMMVVLGMIAAFYLLAAVV